MRAAGVRPVQKGCYSTAARTVAFQTETALEYVEGWARTRDGGTIAHAWVRHASLGDVDLMLDSVELTPVLVLGAIDVAQRMLAGPYGPWSDDLIKGRPKARTGDGATRT